MATQTMNLFSAARGFLRAFWRAARELFHEITGALFLVIAVSALQACWRGWQRGAPHWLIGLGAGYALLMIFFGVLAFRDSRHVR